jgi:hypothetical protein
VTRSADFLEVLRLARDSIVTFHDVLYVLELVVNLLSSVDLTLGSGTPPRPRSGVGEGTPIGSFGGSLL